MSERAFTSKSTLIAILLYLLAILLFDLMGLLIKVLGQRYAPIELMAYRNLFGMIPAVIALFVLSGWRGKWRELGIRQWKLAFGRGVVVIIAQLSFYIALIRMDFATATTISYSNALFMVAFAVPLLGEKVGLTRWAAVIIGAIGVVMVMGLGEDAYQAIALLPLMAGLCYALVGITARLFDDVVPSPLLNLYSASASAITAVVFTLFSVGFSSITTGADLAQIVAMGCFGGAAVLTLVISMRMADQSDLAPFSYFGIPLAFILGWVFFGEAPWDAMIPGAFLIILGGLIIVWRERRLRN